MAKTNNKRAKKEKKVDKNKVIFYFIQQKILELTAIVFLFLGFYVIGSWDPFKMKLFDGPPTGFWECLTVGGVYILLVILVAILIFTVVMLIIEFCRANWEWAERRAK